MLASHTAIRAPGLRPAAATPLAAWSRRLGVFALQLILLAGICHRLFSFPTPLALNLFLAGFAVAAVAALLGLAALIVIWRNGTGGARSAAIGLLVSMLLLAWPTAIATWARTLPKINDVTTDVQTPPSFQALDRSRPKGANPATYPGAAFALAQLAAYPDIRPMVTSRGPAETFDVVLATIRKLGWRVVAQEAPGPRGDRGYVEAYDRTLLLGFYDDIAVRVRGDQREARIDVRSASRFGEHDLGQNAARVRGFFKELQAQLQASVATGGPRRRRGRSGAVVPRALQR